MKYITAALKITFCIISLFLLTWLTYVFSYTFLQSPYLQGNDSGIHLTYIQWVDENWSGVFDKLPYWNNQQGGGVSLTQGYPLAFHKIAVLVSRVLSINLAQALRLTVVLALLLFVYGTFFLGWRVFNNQLVGLMAGIMLLITPMMWSFLYIWGFMPYVASFAFIPWYILSLEFLLSSFVNKSRSRGCWLLASVVFLALTTALHPMSGISLVVVTVILGIGFVNPFSNFPLFLRSLTGSALIAVSFLAAISSWLVPFFRYSLLANRDGLNNVEAEMVPQFVAKYFFGYQIPASDYNLRGLNLIFWVTLVSLAGTVFFFFAKKARWSVINLVAILFSWAPPIVWLLYKIPFFTTFLGPRTMIGVMLVTVPLLAGGFLWQLCVLIFLKFPRWLILKFKILKKFSPGLGWLFYSFSWLGCLVLFATLLFVLKHPESNSSLTNYGLYSREFSLQNIWSFYPSPCTLLKSSSIPACQTSLREYFSPQALSDFCKWVSNRHSICQKDVSTELALELFEACQGSFSDPTYCWARKSNFLTQLWFINWPPWRVSTGDLEYHQEVATIAQSIPNDYSFRSDISPNLGHFSQSLAQFTKASFLNLYTFQLSLNHYLWGYQQGAFYTPARASEEEVNNLAWYWGVDEVLLSYMDRGVTQLSQNQVWKEADRFDSYKISRLSFSRSPGILTVTSRPIWLVVGKFDRRAYETLFRLAARGVLPYKDLLLVESDDSGYLDTYSLPELQAFDGLFLSGYGYRNKATAFRLLEEYLRQGGQVFIDTGWQFAAADWDMPDPPGWWPTGKLIWGNVAGQRNISNQTLPVSSLNSFGHTGDVSYSLFSELPSFSQPLVTVGDKVLAAASQVGEGTLVWSGMNMPARVYDSNSEEEIQVFNLLMSQLNKKEYRDYKMELARESSDAVRLTALEDIPIGTFAYFRETHEPAWQLFSNTNIRLDKSWPTGPQLQGYFLPNLRAGDSVFLRYKLGWWGDFFRYLSWATFVFLLIWAIEQFLFSGKITATLLLKTKLLLFILLGRAKKITVGEETEGDRDAGKS